MDVAPGLPGPAAKDRGRALRTEMEMSLTETIRRIGVLALVACLYGVAGCNTVEGVGEDIEAAGDSIEDEAGDRQ